MRSHPHLVRYPATGWLIFLVTCMGLAQGEDISFRRITSRDGLSEMSVSSIAQDHLGFIWFATYDGLNRYDGYQLRVYAHDATDSSSLSDNWCNVLQPSRDGTLWVGTEHGGLCRYDPLSDKFKVFRHDSHRSGGLLSDKVSALCEDSGGRLWIGTKDRGLCWWDPARETFVRFQFCPEDTAAGAGVEVLSVMEDSHGQLWIGSSRGIYRLSKEEREHGRVTRAAETRAEAPWNTVGVQIASIYEDHYGDIWIGVGAYGLYRYLPAGDNFVQYHHRAAGLSDDWVRCIHEDRSGKLWVGTWNAGLNVLDAERKQFTHYVHDANDEHSLSSDVVMSICEDNAGGVWLGTLEGVSYFDRNRKQFHHIRHRSHDPRTIGNDNIEDVKQDAVGGLWVATRGNGVDYLPPHASSFLHYRHVPSDSRSISSDQVMCISPRSPDRVWIGTRNKGLGMLCPSTGRFTQFVHDPDDPSSIAEDGIIMLHEDRAGDLWIGTQGHGLDCRDRRSGRFHHFSHNPADSTTISGDKIWCIDEDREGNIWVGTWGSGLNRLDRSTGTFVRFLHMEGDPGSLASNSVYSLLVDLGGTLWAGTAAGLSRYNAAAHRFENFGVKNGLPNDNILAILTDDHGAFWLSTNRGLSRFEPGKKMFRNFDQTDGLQDNEFQQEAACVGRDGWMYFAGVGGITAFHPDSIRDNPFVPPVVLISLRVREQLIQTHFGRSNDSTLRLPYDQNFLSLEFAAISFTSSERNCYRYMLEGFDKDWVQAGGRRYAAYTNLDPGRYVFRVQGSNNDGIWNLKGASVAFSIVPPYWRTWWFTALAAIVFVILSAALVEGRFAHLKRRAAEHQEMSRRILESQENERQRIGASLHDSLGQELLIIKNLAVMAADAEKSHKSVDGPLERISTVASQALAEVRQIAYDLRPYQLDRLGLTGALRSVADQIASSSTINLKVDLDNVDGLLPKNQEINLLRIVQESLNNIVKHSSASSAALELKIVADKICLLVTDNGVGFDVSRSGFGLSGIAERARILHGSLEVQSVIGAGTKIIARIPCGQSLS